MAILHLGNLQDLQSWRPNALMWKWLTSVYPGYLNQINWPECHRWLPWFTTMKYLSPLTEVQWWGCSLAPVALICNVERSLYNIKGNDLLNKVNPFSHWSWQSAWIYWPLCFDFHQCSVYLQVSVMNGNVTIKRAHFISLCMLECLTSAGFKAAMKIDLEHADKDGRKARVMV